MMCSDFSTQLNKNNKNSSKGLFIWLRLDAADRLNGLRSSSGGTSPEATFLTRGALVTGQTFRSAVPAESPVRPLYQKMEIQPFKEGILFQQEAECFSFSVAEGLKSAETAQFNIFHTNTSKFVLFQPSFNQEKIKNLLEDAPQEAVRLSNSSLDN